MAVESEGVTAPDAVYVKQRWIPTETVDWVKQCNAIMLEQGSVVGATVYRSRSEARYRGRKLMRLMVELRMHERWDLQGHVSRRAGGYVWTVEYTKRRDG